MIHVFRSILGTISLFLWVACSATIPDSNQQALNADRLPTETPPPIGVDFVTLPPPTQVERVPNTPTPRPSPTVTPSPTPRVVVIEAGDTILGIAIEYDTTTEEVLALNPGLRPEALQIGQPVVVPNATPLSLEALSAATLPIDLAVNQIEMFPTGADRTWILGLIENRGETWAEGVMVELSGPAIGVQSVWLDAVILGPGASAPFGVQVPGTIDPDSEVAITISAGAGLPGPEPLRLISLSPLRAELVEGARVSIEVIAPAALEEIDLLVIYFDRQDRLIGFGRERVRVSLAEGEAWSFELNRVPPGGDPVKIESTVVGRLSDPTP